MRGWIAGIGAVSVAALTACGTGAATQGVGSSEEPVAVATTTQLGSVVSQIATCAGATSATVMGPGDDPHDFSASPAQVAQMARAKLVITNGLGLEQGLDKSIRNAKSDGASVFEVAPALDPIDFGAEDARQAEAGAPGHEGHQHGAKDPHFWLDAARMARGADLIGQELARRTQDDKYAGCGRQMSEDITRVDRSIRDALAVIPAERRTLITDHEAFGYFAAAYGFKLGGAVVPGGSTDAEPSSQELAKLAETVRQARVPAVFSNTAVNTKMVDALAKEAGQNVKVVQLYVGSVGPQGSGADTYQTMMTTNAQRIADALK